LLTGTGIDIITAEAMTLAHQLATGQKTSHDVIDENFDKLHFRDRDGLPDWFIEDESKHDKKQKPITKEAAMAIKEKTRALNARPIKKVSSLTQGVDHLEG
jgi:AdoMet-dependent rRNA methyltransferase SPB1